MLRQLVARSVTKLHAERLTAKNLMQGCAGLAWHGLQRLLQQFLTSSISHNALLGKRAGLWTMSTPCSLSLLLDGKEQQVVLDLPPCSAGEAAEQASSRADAAPARCRLIPQAPLAANATWADSTLLPPTPIDPNAAAGPRPFRRGVLRDRGGDAPELGWFDIQAEPWGRQERRL